MVEKVGRPRAPGERYPSGQRRVSADFRSEVQFQRMKEQARLMGLDPIMTSQAGRLFCAGLITSRHMATIDYIAKVYAAYEKHAGQGASRRMRSPSYEPSTNRTERLDEDFEQTGDAMVAKDEFEKLQALIPDSPREIREAIERICVDDQMIPTAWVRDLALMLTMIEEVRNGTRPVSKLSRTGLPLRKSRAAPKTPPRQEKFEKGLYASATKVPHPNKLTGEELAAAERDREGLERFLEAGNSRREATQEPVT